MSLSSAKGVAWVAAVIAVVATGCTTIEGSPTAPESASARSQATTTKTTTTTSDSPSATPTGPPVGTATMQVSGGAGTATIRYQINGGPEQTEPNVTLPWQKQYPVYNEIQTSVTADGGDADLICSITMDGKLAAFKSEPRPTCSFAYYG